MNKRIVWTPELRAEIERRYPHERTENIARDIGISAAKIYSRANYLGISKTPEYLVSPDACRLRRGDDVGAEFRFKKGQIPSNKGIKGVSYPGMEATQFKPGQKPKNWLPVGSERVSDAGYLQRKITDTGYTPRDWVSVHVITWEQEHGKVPPGHAVIFRDGNKRNFSPGNLECISRVELMKRNTIHNLPKELKQIIQLNGILKKVINNASRKQK